MGVDTAGVELAGKDGAAEDDCGTEEDCAAEDEGVFGDGCAEDEDCPSPQRPKPSCKIPSSVSMCFMID